MAEKPITSDPDEQELLKSMNIPLTDPAAKEDVDETHTETPADETPAEPPAATADTVEGDPAGDAGGAGGKGTDEPVPAPADAEPAATVVEPADGGGDGDAPVTPAKSAVTPPAETPQPILSPAAKRLEEVEALILAEEFDPFSVEGRKLQLEHNRLAAKVEAEPLLREQQQAAAWKPYREQFPSIEQAKMQEVFARQVQTYGKRGLTGDALNAAATVAFEFELAQIANGKKGAEVAKEKTKGAVVAPPVAKTPITPKGAIVAPPSASSIPAAPKRELTDEEELVATQRKLNPQGMRAALRG